MSLCAEPISTLQHHFLCLGCAPPLLFITPLVSGAVLFQNGIVVPEKVQPGQAVWDLKVTFLKYPYGQYCNLAQHELDQKQPFSNNTINVTKTQVWWLTLIYDIKNSSRVPFSFVIEIYINFKATALSWDPRLSCFISVFRGKRAGGT